MLSARPSLRLAFGLIATRARTRRIVQREAHRKPTPRLLADLLEFGFFFRSDLACVFERFDALRESPCHGPSCKALAVDFRVRPDCSIVDNHRRSVPFLVRDWTRQGSRGSAPARTATAKNIYSCFHPHMFGLAQPWPTAHIGPLKPPSLPLLGGDFDPNPKPFEAHRDLFEAGSTLLRRNAPAPPKWYVGAEPVERPRGMDSRGRLLVPI